MIKDKSSSVKLDLGGTEDEEEEEIEEVEEEAEIQEIDGETEDMDDQVLEMDDIGDPQAGVDVEEGNKIRVYNTSEQNPEKNRVGFNSSDENQNNNQDIQKSHSNSKIQKDLTLKQDQGEKTVFTRLSEELYKKFFLKRDQSYKKTSAYDFFVNDKFLNRVVEKNDPSASVKFGNFLNRNKEYVDRKVTKLNERIQKMTNEINSNCTGIPNGKVLSKEELRDPNEFLKDQLKYYQSIGQQIESLRKDVLTNTNLKMRDAPEISKKSKLLAEKKLSGENVADIHDRLHKEKLNKEKKYLIRERKDENPDKKEMKSKAINEIKELVEKLHKDAQERKMKKTQILKDDKKLKEIYDIYNSEDELTTFNTRVLILEKFVQSFERSLHNLFNKRESIEINFEEYCKLMKSLGFILFDHADKFQPEISGINTLENQTESYSKIEKEELTNLKTLNDLQNSDNAIPSQNKNNNFNSTKCREKKEKSMKEKEYNLLKDSWNIISNGEGTKINSNQLLIFCASVLGIYKGESESNLAAASLESNKVIESNTSDLNENKTKTPTLKSGNILVKNPKLNNTSNKTNKKTKIPNRFSTYKEVAKYNTVHGLNYAVSLSRNKHPNISYKQSERNPLMTVIPDFESTKYFYLPSTVKLIKELFVTMYLNRTEFLAKEKKKSKESKLDQKNENKTENFGKKPSKKLRRSAENFKRRVLEEYETFKHNISQSPNQSLNNTNNLSKKKKIKMEDIYRILKLKKENEIVKFKEEQKELELKECTFQPNKDLKKINHKDVKETINKLYINGVNKIKSKNSADLKEPEELVECTFHPEIHELNSRVFEVNPLLHDERIKKEVEKLEKARIDRKIKEYKKQRGVNSIRNFNSVELKTEELPQWRFEIEKKTFRDPIEIAINDRGGSNKSDTVSRRDFNKTIKFDKNSRRIKEPLFNVEVNIDDNYRTERLEIFSDDDPSKLAESFTRKYGLSQDKKDKLQLIIQQKLSEHLI